MLNVFKIIIFFFKAIKGLSLFSLEALINGIKKDSAEITKEIKNGYEINNNITNYLNILKNLQEIIKEQIAELNEQKSSILLQYDKITKIRKKREINMVKSLEIKVYYLQFCF